MAESAWEELPIKMKVYITTKSPLDGAREDVVRFQYDEYADEEYAILTLSGFTKILEIASAWSQDSLETIFYEDVNALIEDYCRGHSPTRLQILADEEIKKRYAEQFQKWASEEDEVEISTKRDESTTAKEATVKHNSDGSIRKMRARLSKHLDKRIGEEEWQS